jgi:polar amino acid transport system substrate-binding protein
VSQRQLRREARQRGERVAGWARLPPLILLALLSMAVGAAAQAPLPAYLEKDSLRGGWYPWDPYQYQDYSRGLPVLTGFDVEIERALARIMGVEISLPEIGWNDHLAALAAGTADIAAGATESEARDHYAYFSKPYRTETDVLILPRGMSGRYPFRSVDEMLATFSREKFRLGVVAGFVYADSRVNAFIAKAARSGQIVAADSDAQNLRNLRAGVIDGFLADRMTATTTAWRRHEGSLIEVHPLHFSTDIRFMLSRVTQTPQMLARLDDAIDELKQSGELRRIAYTYALPVLINQTLDREWFRILSFIGLVAFALSGVVLAYEGKYTVFGALILATLPAVGGGVVRDLLLQRSPLGIVRSPEALLGVFGTVLAGLLVIKVISWSHGRLANRYLQARASAARLIEVFDAIGLAAFTVTGVVVALDASAQPLWLWGPIAAVLTSSFGGLLRDLFRNDRVIANLSGELYPEIAAVWGLALALFLRWEAERLRSDEIRLAVAVTILGAFASRMVAISLRAKGWRYA